MDNYYYSEIRKLEKKFSDKLETIGSSWSECVVNFDSRIFSLSLPYWENCDGFEAGNEISGEDWVNWGKNNEIDISTNYDGHVVSLEKIGMRYIDELETYLEETCKKCLDITEEDISKFFDENIVGNSYDGMFRPYHFVAIDPKDSEIYDSIQVSENSWTNYRGFKVWDNGEEGCYDRTILGIDSIRENIVDFLKQGDTEMTKDEFYSLSLKEQEKWIVGNVSEEDIDEAGGYILDELKEKFVSFIKEEIEREGYFLKTVD